MAMFMSIKIRATISMLTNWFCSTYKFIWLKNNFFSLELNIMINLTDNKDLFKKFPENWNCTLQYRKQALYLVEHHERKLLKHKPDPILIIKR